MTTSLRSLRDWLADQLAEVRHVSPLAVLAPPKPVAVPDLDDMPSVEEMACCERGTAEAFPDCDAAAEYAVRLHVHPPFLWLLCAAHLDEFKARWLDDFRNHRDPLTCSTCGREFRMLSDIIESEVRL